MRILQLASGDLWAGAEVQLFYLAVSLAQYKEVTLLVVLLNHGQLEQELLSKGVKVVVLNEARLSGLSILLRFYRLVKSFQPDIIHTHRNKENVIGGLVARLTGKKSVRTAHGATELNAGLMNPRRLIFDALDRISGYFFQQRIVAVSNELKLKLQEIYPRKRLVVIENCIDEDYVVTKSKENSTVTLDSRLFNITFIGRFVPVKRVDLFYELAKRTISSPVGNRVIFHMIGDGPLSAEIMQRLSADNLSERIKLHGFMANPAPLLRQMNLLVFTSDHEGLPMTLLEAMSLSIPVLSRNLPTIREVLCDGGCGYVLNNGDIDDFVKNIVRIIGDSKDAMQRAGEAKKRVQEKYTTDNAAKKYLSLYASL